MDGDKKNKKDKPRSVIRKTAIAILVIVCVTVFAILLFRGIEKLESAGKGSVTRNSSASTNINKYYSAIDPFGPPVNSLYSYSPNSNSSNTIPGTNNCQIYTYENIFSSGEYGSTLDVTSYTKPNINSVFFDYVNGFNHTGGDFQCVSSDQIEAVNISRECLSAADNVFNTCYTKQGLIVEKGTSYSFPALCSTKPQCEGLLGSISLNYKLDNGKLDRNSMCLGVSSITVPSSIYNDPKYNYYKELGILEETKIGLSAYPVKLTSLLCNTKSAVQKFLITSYNYGPHIPKSENNQQDQTEVVGFYPVDVGFYKSIIYKPLNAYLDIDTQKSSSSGTRFVLRPLTLGTSTPVLDTVKWMLFPSFNPSSGRYPITQRCDFIPNKILSGGKPDLVPTPLQSNQTFIESIFAPVGIATDKQESYKSYCTLPAYLYPIFVFKNLTPNCTLNPSLFYNFKIKYFESQSSPNFFEKVAGALDPFAGAVEAVTGLDKSSTKYGFYFKSKSNPPKFNYGDKFLDGNCTIEVINYENLIARFPQEYFSNTEGAVISLNPIIGTNSSTIVNSGNYVESGTGLIETVTITRQPFPKNSSKYIFKNNSYTGITPIKETSSSGGTTLGSGAVFNITVSTSVDSNTGLDVPVIVGSITSTGKNYAKGDLLTIDSSQIGLSVFTDPVLSVSNTSKQLYVFRAIPMKTDGILSTEPLIPDVVVDDFPVRDFSFYGTYDFTNGLVQVGPIISSGFNYSATPGTVLNKIYLMQLNLDNEGFGTSQSGAELLKNLKNQNQSKDTLMYVTPSSVTDGNYSGETPAPFSLFPPGKMPQFEYNFLSGSKMGLSSCSPQLIYGGEIIGGGTSTLIDIFAKEGITNASGLESFFLSYKSGGLDTNITFLKSLQYKDIKYSTTQGQVNVNGVSEIILGKFIPYSSFKPMEPGITDSASELGLTQGINILPSTDTIDEYYNANQFGFIPYGQDSVYDTSFITGFNN